MKVLIKVDSMFLKPGKATPRGVHDTKELGVSDERVKALLKSSPQSIEKYVEKKKGDKEDGGGDQSDKGNGQGTGDDTPVKKAYDDITANEMKAFLKGKVDDELLKTDDKKTLYKLYEEHFTQS